MTLPSQVDFFAVELLDGSLYLLLDMGSGTIKVKSTQTKVNDGAWYHVDIQRDGRSGQLILTKEHLCCSAIRVSLISSPCWHRHHLCKQQKDTVHSQW